MVAILALHLYHLYVRISSCIYAVQHIEKV